MQEFMLFVHAHWFLNLVFAIGLVAVMILEFIKNKQATTQVSPSQLTQLMNHENAAVIDVRPANQFQEGHIIGAQSIPADEFDDKKKKLEKIKGRPLVFVCALGPDAARCADAFNQPGMVTRTLAGGMKAWREAELPVVKD